MKVKITKCCDRFFWYKDRIGEIFEVETFDERRYRVVYLSNIQGNLIHITDCEIIKDENQSVDNPITPLNTQIGGNHYKDLVIQPIEYCQKNKMGYCESNVVKYITRWKFKNGLEDLKKAIHNIELLIELEGLEDDTKTDK